MLSIFVVLFFSIFHSLFGMGLLLFGTPTLLLFGFPYEQILVILLPSSITINLFQLYHNRQNISHKTVYSFMLFCLPFVIICMSLYMYTKVKLNLEIAVSFVLFFSLLIRIIPTLKKWMQQIIYKFQKPFLIIMGVIHGFTNLGGALLSVFASSQHTRKEDIIACISFCYVIFATFQIGLLLVFKPYLFNYKTLLFCLISASVYLTFGKVIFASASQYFYERLFSIFIFIYSVLLFLKGLKIISYN
ncbi:hypothetical protein B4U84_27515 [Westiellopsis prolifica IICB1]|nr:hypothetical protein B4U84_27515 [Westiellopsis prolifica IICB1]